MLITHNEKAALAERVKLNMNVAIIGAGAAGCFCSIELKRLLPEADVKIFEAGKKPLAKVSVTGGGRCNLTNSFAGIEDLSLAYPRGDKLMKRAFRTFDHQDTWEWFEKEGVRLTLQDDQCVFPKSQDAMEIVNILLRRMRELDIQVHTLHRVERIAAGPSGQAGYSITFSGSSVPAFNADAVVVTTGGSPKESGLKMLEGLGLEMVPPVPSLFSFNIPDLQIRALMGTVADDVTVSLAGTKFKASGPLLITDWGMSGPAILKLSSYAARCLAENEYRATLSVNWLGNASEEDVRKRLSGLAASNPQKMMVNCHPEEIPSRLWNLLLRKSGIREDSRWAEAGSKGLNRLCNTLINDSCPIQGKSRFKDEFVTCGGVSLSSINLNTLEAKTHPGLYFAGEVLDVDAITGGFNLQAAWSTGYLAAHSIAASHI